MGTLLFYGSLPIFFALLQPSDYFSGFAVWFCFWMVFIHLFPPLDDVFSAWLDRSAPRLPALLRSNLFSVLVFGALIALSYLRGFRFGLSAWLLVIPAARLLLFLWEKIYPPSSYLDSVFTGEAQEIVDSSPGLWLHDDNTDPSFLNKPITDSVFTGEVQEIIESSPGLWLHDDNTDLSVLDKPFTDKD
jgi:hypothetical protein